MKQRTLVKQMITLKLNICFQDYDPNEENPGSGPFSEPEAQMMRKLSRSFKPHLWVNVHSGMEVNHNL